MERLLTETGIAITLREGGPYTLFAPTDAAFAALGQEKIDFLEEPEFRDRLHAQLQRYIIMQPFSPQADAKSLQLESADRSKLSIEQTNGHFRLNGIEAKLPPFAASNGRVYPLQGVLPIDDSVFDR